MGASDWDHVKASVPIGSEVTGRVVASYPFGVFLDLGLGFPGLLELHGCVDPAARSKREVCLPAVDTVLTAHVLQHMDQNQQLRLTQRAVSAEQWDRIRAFLAAWPAAEKGTQLD